ncbi:cell division protein FtsL [Candidatus Profftia sp. (ex Adelges kitamiensis)]|uniref:cell division protein FtsL n=1 Tax=Candidatus Profftia sp. (ex Adelges kitamiensis) TaxID=2864218 RepID=UPI001CE25077|nr:cell division protein FtsL [Candidatus Profftia sp. (ex Adelges kitamiensis)]
MISNYRYTLITIISRDIIRQGKIVYFLFISVLISAVFVVIITHNTRLLIIQREQLFIARIALDVEWRNLLLEENVLGDHIRIEQIAIKKLHMQYIDPCKENILIK